MAEAELSILVRCKDEASKTFQNIQGRIQSMSKQLRIAGGVMMGVGTGITAALGSAMKAATEEEAGITRLSVAMHNMGIEYDQVKGSLEAWIDAQQQKTAVADTAQRSSLASLIRMTGDLTKSQELLTLAMDVAVGTNRDLESATTLLMYAMGGNWGMLERYIPALKTCKDEEEKWAKLRQMFAGQAEAYGQTMAGQFELLKNNIGDIKETIGGFIATALTPLVNSLQDIVVGIKSWTQEHPELTRTITLVMGAVGALLIPLGGLLILLPTIVNSFSTLTGAIGIATTSVWGFYASLAGIAGIAAIISRVLSDISGNTAYVTQRWDELGIVTKFLLDPMRALTGEMSGLIDEQKRLELASKGVIAIIEGESLRLFYTREEIEKLTDAEKESLIWINKVAQGFEDQAIEAEDLNQIIEDLTKDQRKLYEQLFGTTDALEDQINALNKAAQEAGNLAKATEKEAESEYSKARIAEDEADAINKATQAKEQAAMTTEEAQEIYERILRQVEQAGRFVSAEQAERFYKAAFRISGMSWEAYKAGARGWEALLPETQALRLEWIREAVRRFQEEGVETPMGRYYATYPQAIPQVNVYVTLDGEEIAKKVEILTAEEAHEQGLI